VSNTKFSSISDISRHEQLQDQYDWRADFTFHNSYVILERVHSTTGQSSPADAKAK